MKIKNLAVLFVFMLAITACGNNEETESYDEPSEVNLAVTIDAINTEVIKNWDDPYSVDDFEQIAKHQVCDMLPEDPKMSDIKSQASELASDMDIKLETANALIVFGSGTWCEHKYTSVFGELPE